MELIIGTRSWSSWSLRPWLALKRAGAPFTTTLVALRRPDTAEQIARHSPSGKVPALKDGDLTVWDSLAICEYLAERFPRAALWPADPTARALGRAASAEMHSGFTALRSECPMDLGLRQSAAVSPATAADVRRIVALWSDLRRRYQHGGPFLLGPWSIADAMFTPVATRFRSHGIGLSDYGDQDLAGAYCDALLSTPEFIEWEALAAAELVAT